MRTHESTRRRQRLTIQLKFNAKKEGSFRSRNQPAKIERFFRIWIKNPRIHQQIERIAGIPPNDTLFRKILLNRSPVLRIRKKIPNPPINFCLESIARTFFRKFISRQRTKYDFRPIAQKTARPNQMLARTPINQRVRTARIVANHPPDHRTVRSRSLRSKKQSVRF